MVRAKATKKLVLLLASVAAVAAVTAGLVGCTDDGEVAEPVAEPAGWKVTVYYTAVEHLHDGPPRRVVGCLELDCVAGDDHIGYYPSDFVDAVEFEGTGRLETGLYAGRYLNWSLDVGFWVDDVARDSQGGELVPFASAAADPDVLAPGTAFHLSGCGTADDGSTIPAPVCQRLSGPRWTVADEFTPGFGGERHVDLYVGEETSSTFTDSPISTTFIGAELTMDGTVGGGPELGPTGAGPFGTVPPPTSTTTAGTTTTHPPRVP